MKILPVSFLNYNKINSSKNVSFRAREMQVDSFEKINQTDKTQVVLNKIFDDFKQFPQTQAIAIGGSSATGYGDSASDIDIYVFTDGEIPAQKREEMIKKYSTKYDAGQDYFGPDDEFLVDELDREIDVIYFDKNWIEDNVKNVWLNHRAQNGYTTCFLYTLKNAKTQYDRDNWLQDLKNTINTPYPEELKQNIIQRNMQLMKDKPFSSYIEQIDKAQKRVDRNSVNHRTAEFMASYFDALFAANELLHPGEKRLVKFAKDNCSKLPQDFEENINQLMNRPNSNIASVADNMVENLREIC